jgi:hypothetical protein
MNPRTYGAAALILTAAALAAAPAQADAPANDAREDATGVGALPARLAGKTAGSTRQQHEQGSPCAPIAGSVWYRLDAKASRRVVVRLRAGGDLDATVDVFERFRSQQRFLTCDVGDTQGRAAASFAAEQGHSYLVRVGRRRGSARGPFKLALSNVRGPRLPGPALPDTGVGGSLDRVARTAQPWSVWLTAGVRYRVSVVHHGAGCLRTSLYRPHTSPASAAGPTASIDCDDDGYAIFTPREGQGGRYSVLVRAADAVRGPQRYHLQVAPAGPDDSAPGVFVGNYARVPGGLDGAGVDAVDLYRFDVTRRSVLFLHLQAGAQRRFDLDLRDQWGHRVGCACDGNGGQSLHKGLRPGRFFVAVRSRDGSTGSYRLLRASRTITKTRLRVNDGGRAQIAPGSSTALTVSTEPAVSGPVTVVVAQFDPLGGWQFVRALHARVVNGIATLHYAPPTVGRWRASASYDGTQSSAPSETPGFVKLLVAEDLRD